MTLLDDDILLVQRGAQAYQMGALQLKGYIDAGSGTGNSSVTVGENPPVDPDNGDLWWNSGNGYLYVYYIEDDYNDGAGPGTAQWVQTVPSGEGEGGEGASVVIDSNPPQNPSEGDLWWNSSDGFLYIYYIDENSDSYWVSANPGGTGGGEDTSNGLIAIGPNPPEEATSSNEGMLWYNENDGNLYVSYTDENSSQWINASPSGGGGTDTTVSNLQQVTDEGSTTTNSITVGDLLTVSGDGSSADGKLKLNCSQNSHGVTIQSPPHSANASYTLTLPNDTGINGQVLSTDGSGELFWQYNASSNRNLLINSNYGIAQRYANYPWTATGVIANNNPESLFGPDRWCTPQGREFQSRSERPNNFFPGSIQWRTGTETNATWSQVIELLGDGTTAPRLDPLLSSDTWTVSHWIFAADRNNFVCDIAYVNKSYSPDIVSDIALIEDADWETVETEGDWIRVAASFSMTGVAPAVAGSLGIRVQFRNDSNIRAVGAQLEPGPVATPFEWRPIGTELALCQRYFQTYVRLKLYKADSDIGRYLECPRPVIMRAAPTETSDGPLSHAGTAVNFNSLGNAANSTAGLSMLNYKADAEL